MLILFLIASYVPVAVCAVALGLYAYDKAYPQQRVPMWGKRSSAAVGRPAVLNFCVSVMWTNSLALLSSSDSTTGLPPLTYAIVIGIPVAFLLFFFAAPALHNRGLPKPSASSDSPNAGDRAPVA